MKKIAIFDIDGTIFRSSLLIELTDALIQEGIFPEEAKNTYAKAYNNWLDRKGSYEKYIEEVVRAFEKNIKGVDYDDFLKISKEVASFHKSRIYRYSQKIIKDLKAKNYYLLAISGSPKAIVEEFCKNFEFDKIYGRMYEVNKNNKFTGKELYTDLISDKSKILQRAIEEEKLTLKNSVGMGDTETDITFLKMVEKPICFNPNKKLYQCAKKAGWEIIVERKDVIYHL
jgi:HAD superfamily hydrolase (TIGR01490 family)